MGTILMKADLNEFSIDKLKQYCFDHLSHDEVNFFVRNSELREVLVKCDISPMMQCNLHESRNLSREECISILENSSQIYNSVITEHQYDIELLRKVEDKINLNYVDCQDSLDVEFVVKHAGSMDISDFVRRRVNNGTIHKFLSIPQVVQRYIRVAMNWTISRTDLIEFILHNKQKPELSRDDIEKFVNDMYNKPVTEETLAAAYSDRIRASHSIDTVVSYFKRNRQQIAYSTWDEYVAECKSTGDDGLADVWFRDFHRAEICEFAGIKM